MEIILFFGFVAPPVLWLGFYKAASGVHSFRPNYAQRIFVGASPLVCTLFIAVVILRWASPDVRSSPHWVVFYTMCGATWIWLGMTALSFLGISTRDDVLERQNPAAAWVVCGALAGTAFCYAGGNVGRGPGPEAVFFSALLPTITLFILWFWLDSFFQLGDRVTIERDVNTGIRLSGWMSAMGIILGAGVTGNWISFENTFYDFVHSARLATCFFIAATAIELVCKYRREWLKRRASAAVALVYLAAAITFVVLRGVK